MEEAGRTPAGLQSLNGLARRRIFVAALNLVSMALLSWALIQIFSAGSLVVADIVIFGCFWSARLGP